eukprot:765232-Hanusia_phi.AAC.2
MGNLASETPSGFKALKHVKAKYKDDNDGALRYQAGNLKAQNPDPVFPVTLAAYAMVFAKDQEWSDGDDQNSFAKKIYWVCVAVHGVWILIHAQPLADKLRSSDMIVRADETDATDGEKHIALVYISEKRQRTVAEHMSNENLLFVRLKESGDALGVDIEISDQGCR